MTRINTAKMMFTKKSESKIGDERLLTVAILAAVCIIILLSPSAFAAAPNPGHTASQISGGTFSSNDGNFNFVTNVSIAGGSPTFGGIGVPLSVGDGTQMIGSYFNSSLGSLIGEIATESDSNFAILGWDGPGGYVEGHLARYEDDEGWMAVKGKYAQGSGPQAFLANGTIAVYGVQGDGDYAGYFEGNVTTTGLSGDFCISGGNCLSTAGAGSLGGSGIAGRIAKWDTGGTDLTNTIMTENGNCLRIDAAGSTCTGTEVLVVDGRIGVGTTTPAVELHVDGTIVGNSTPGGGSGIIPVNTGVFGVGTWYGVYGRWGDAGDYPYGILGGEEWGALGRSSATVYGALGYGAYPGIFMGGNVGIGTITPAASLHVQDGTVVGNNTYAGTVPASTGVYGGGTNYGVIGRGGAAGVQGNDNDGSYGYLGYEVNSRDHGVYGSAASGASIAVGVGGLAYPSSGTGYGVYGNGSHYGVYGETSYGPGYGVYARNSNTNRVAFLTGPSYGLWANYSATSYGYIGNINEGVFGKGLVGVKGEASTDSNRYGYLGSGTYGAYAQFSQYYYGYIGGASSGVFGNASGGSASPPLATGVIGVGSGAGIYGKGGTWAGLFDGNVNVTNNIFYGGNLTGYGADFAEMLPTAEKVNSGDVVCFNNNMQIKKCSSRADPAVAGVISENPTIIGNGKVTDGIPVGIAGIVSTKVTGPIARFDLLTTSKIPGHAEKATIEDFGSIIGKAMEPCDKEYCTIKVLVGLR